MHNGSLTGADIADDTLKGTDIDESTLNIAGGARAYAGVASAACDAATGRCTPEQSKGVASITRTETGGYCVAVTGVDSSMTPAAVTVEFNGTADPEGNASAMTDERFGCGPAEKGFRVVTDRQPQIPVDANGGTNNQFVTGAARGQRRQLHDRDPLNGRSKPGSRRGEVHLSARSPTVGRSRSGAAGPARR